MTFNFLDFLRENYTWIFSGIGIPIIVLIIQFFRKRLLVDNKRDTIKGGSKNNLKISGNNNTIQQNISSKKGSNTAEITGNNNKGRQES